MANQEILFEACKNGSIEQVESLLTQRQLWIFKKFKVSSCDKYGCTSLHYAASGAQKGIAELLIAKGADVNVKDDNGGTPLHATCYSYRGHKDIVELLIEKGANVNAKDKCNRQPLHNACSSWRNDLVELLITKGVDVNAKDDNGETPLHATCLGCGIRKESSYEIVELLIAKGADVNAKDYEGWTPMHNACCTCQNDLVELLITKGADVNAETKKKVTPLQVAFDARDNNSNKKTSDSTRKTNDEYEVLFRFLIMNGAVVDTSNKVLVDAANRLKQQTLSKVQHIALPQEFAENALNGSVRWRISIRQISSVVTALNKKLQEAGVPSNTLYDLCNNSLLSVCPICNECCAGKALLMMNTMRGANSLFTGNSGGFERMLAGRCLNYSCNSTEHELFWCPDLNPTDFAELNSRGIRIDPNIQHTRDHVWKPKDRT